MERPKRRRSHRLSLGRHRDRLPPRRGRLLSLGHALRCRGPGLRGNGLCPPHPALRRGVRLRHLLGRTVVAATRPAGADRRLRAGRQRQALQVSVRPAGRFASAPHNTVERDELSPMQARPTMSCSTPTGKRPTASRSPSRSTGHRAPPSSATAPASSTLNWGDLEAAAAPWIEEWHATNDEVARAAQSPGKIEAFFVGYDVRASDAGDPLRIANRCLNSPELLDTPKSIADPLGDKGFALWSDAAGQRWHLSTAACTIVLGQPETSLGEGRQHRAGARRRLRLHRHRRLVGSRRLEVALRSTRPSAPWSACPASRSSATQGTTPRTSPSRPARASASRCVACHWRSDGRWPIETTVACGSRSFSTP